MNDVWAQREDPEKTQEEDRLLKASESGLIRNQPRRHLDLGLPASRM
jgi:hypothetical protein